VSRRRAPLRIPAALALLAALVLAGAIAAARGLQRTARALAAPVDLSRVAYVGSDECRACHAGRHASWSRTFHRTMTQRAAPGAVLGDFRDASLTWGGVTSRLTRQGDTFFITTLDAEDPASGQMTRYPVELTVGSRRVQQYVTQIGTRHWRLPLAWDVEEGRWFHLAGGFLHPDGSDFHTHTALWDANCIFCHNVKAQPRFDPAADTFSARVEELGVACEACHGPGALHAERAADRRNRWAMDLLGARDAAAVSPWELSAERQVQVCGHCHGQRLPNPHGRIREYLTVGDPYTAGDDLARFASAIGPDTELDGVDFSLRFWGDGTPRLTAHEYQSLLLTRDYREGGLTCIHCHSMHGGDPRGMIAPEMRGKAACVSCHPAIDADVAGHTGHRADGPGSDCYACHMPRITYGLVETHPTHRIQVPDPSRAWRHDMPEACTLCHVNRTAAWAAEAMTERFGQAAGSAATAAAAEPAPEGDFREIAESVRALFAGDVVQRAVAARALDRAVPYAETEPGSPGGQPLWAVPLLILTLEDDYPAIRRFAARGLRELLAREGVTPPETGFDPMDGAAERAAALERWWGWWAAADKGGIPHPGEAVPLDEDLMPRREVMARLKAGRDERVIAIGE
jgi:predicted CXXCH cytochrome family protein